MFRLITTVISRISALRSKVTYTVDIYGTEDSTIGASVIPQSAAVTTVIDRVVSQLLRSVDPDAEFAADCSKDTTQTGTTEVRLVLGMGNGDEIVVKLDLTTIGYTPEQTALHELVATGISAEIGAIVDTWHPDLATDDRATLIAQIETLVRGQLRIGDMAGAGAPG